MKDWLKNGVDPLEKGSAHMMNFALTINGVMIEHANIAHLEEGKVTVIKVLLQSIIMNAVTTQKDTNIISNIMPALGETTAH